MTLRCRILTLKTSDLFFRSFRFLRQNGAFSATEQNQTYKNSLFFRIPTTIQQKTYSLWRIPILTKYRFRIVRKKKNNISQMRMSILNIATTEQMGYIVFSFFVYTKSTTQNFPRISTFFPSKAKP